MIDGAHTLGSLDLNLYDIGADYYVGNTHKWFCSVKGCAFLYVKPEIQNTIHSINTAAYGSGFSQEFYKGNLSNPYRKVFTFTTLNFLRRY